MDIMEQRAHDLTILYLQEQIKNNSIKLQGDEDLEELVRLYKKQFDAIHEMFTNP